MMTIPTTWTPEPKGLPWGRNYVTTQCIKSLGLTL